ncbi:MAG: hypothetical protein KF780_11195 [Sphingomonas sp.]|nr:hypothetical protein [Sphingomonas sp.]
MRKADVDLLDGAKTYWVPAVHAPVCDWPGAPGCRRGARFLIDEASLRPARDNYPLFESRGDCLRWIMAHRVELVRTAPDADVTPVDLARWLLGLSG